MANKKFNLSLPTNRTGLTVYAVIIRQSDGYYLNSSGSFVLALPSTFPLFTENSSVAGLYELSEASVFADGLYIVRCYARAGASPALSTDELLGIGDISTYADAEIILANDTTTAKESTLTTKIPTALSFTGANVNAESKATAAPADMALDSTVMKAASYTAPDNSGISAIKAKTDNLPASPAAVGSAMTLTSAYDSAKTAAQESTSTAIKAKTDLIPAAGIAEQATSLLIKAKTDLIPAGGIAQESTSTAIKAKTDLIPASGIAEQATSLAIKAKTDLLPSDPASDTTITDAEDAILAAVAGISEALTSFDTYVDQLVTLSAVHNTQILNAGIPFDPAEIVGVGIYPTWADAEAGTNEIEIIDPADITRVSMGHYTYTVASIATASVYFKAFICNPTIGSADRRFISSWYVRKTSSGTPPGPHETAIVKINTFAITGTRLVGETFTVTLQTGAPEYLKDLISNSAVSAVTDSNGIASFTLTETDTMQITNGVRPYYTVAAASFAWSYGFRIPVGSGEINIFDLPKV